MNPFLPMRYAGRGNCTRVPGCRNLIWAMEFASQCRMGLSDGCREDAELRELVANWHRLTPSVRVAIMELVRGG